MGGTQGRKDAGDARGRRRFAVELALVGVVCVLAGFAVGVVRSHSGGGSSHPVTVRTTVSIPPTT